MIAQLLGGLCAAAVVSALFPGPMTVETTLGGGTSIAQGLFIEMFLTAELVFVVLMLAAEKHKATYLAPVGIGISFFLCELVGECYTHPLFPQTLLLAVTPVSVSVSSLTISPPKNRRRVHGWIPQPGPIARSGRR